MLFVLRPRSKRPAPRQRTRRLQPESLETRRVLAGSFDFCLPADHAQVPSHEWSPSRADFGRHAHNNIVQSFRINGGGNAPNGIPLIPGESGPHDATGFAKGLGRYTGDGELTVDSIEISPTTGAVTGTFHGKFVFTGANGEKLAVTYGDGGSGILTGQLSADGSSVVNVQFDAFFSPDPANSTGRFERAVGGGWQMIAKADSVDLVPGSTNTAPFDYTWSGRGKLEFAKPNIVKPFRINGGGEAPIGLPLSPLLPPGPHDATGIATGLGRYSGEGEFSLDSLDISPTTGAVTGTFHGTFVFTAANGDKLAVTYGDGGSGILTGQLSADGSSVVDVQFDAFFTPDPDNSTGRFKNVVGGGWQMLAKADSADLVPGSGYTAPFDYSWSGKGTLEYARRSR